MWDLIQLWRYRWVLPAMLGKWGVGAAAGHGTICLLHAREVSMRGSEHVSCKGSASEAIPLPLHPQTAAKPLCRDLCFQTSFYSHSYVPLQAATHFPSSPTFPRLEYGWILLLYSKWRTPKSFLKNEYINFYVSSVKMKVIVQSHEIWGKQKIRHGCLFSQ